MKDITRTYVLTIKSDKATIEWKITQADRNEIMRYLTAKAHSRGLLAKGEDNG